MQRKINKEIFKRVLELMGERKGDVVQFPVQFPTNGHLYGNYLDRITANTIKRAFSQEIVSVKCAP